MNGSEQHAAASYTGVFKDDPDLRSHEEHFRYRWKQFSCVLERIDREEGGLLSFARSYTKFGLLPQLDGTVFREWAPAAIDAQLIGDFNNWAGTQMHRDTSGVWSCTLPEMIQHMSKYKIRLKRWDGRCVDVLSAWTKFAVQNSARMDGAFDAVHWRPPHPYQWRFPQPHRPQGLCIYEAHVGMSSEAPVVATYRHFADIVLPHIVHQGYNTLQLMAIQEHPFYGSCGYHITNLFAVSSRSGTPDDLKYLIDTAHSHDLCVILDVVHSHICKNAGDGLAGFDLGQCEAWNYFKLGDRGYHKVWDSRLLNYQNREVLRLLLSNLLWWMEEFRFDGFRFDGVTSMLYHHHGVDCHFRGHYGEYFSTATDVDAAVYLMLANKLVHLVSPEAVTLAEDVSGMPTLCTAVDRGGIGFDYRMAMGIPELWIRTLQDYDDGRWPLDSIVKELQNRRGREKTVAYVECHDQSLVGGKTLAFRLMGTEMWTHMSTLTAPTPNIKRGIALHKVIRLLTFVLGGDAWLNFMGNEFGHPDWVDFPREGNGWSHDRCRRLWSLIQKPHLRYGALLLWDQAMLRLAKEFHILDASHSLHTFLHPTRRIIAVERGPLLCLFNFSAADDAADVTVGVMLPRSYRLVLSSDASEFEGDAKYCLKDHTFCAVPARTVHDGWDLNRPYALHLSLSARSCIALAMV